MSAETIAEQISTLLKKKKLRGEARFNQKLAAYTTWRIGGQAECWYKPADKEDLQNLFKAVHPGVKVYWIGLGSNVLIRDGGLKGIVISTNGTLNNMMFVPPVENKMPGAIWQVTAEAGVTCAVFARKTATKALSGVEFLSGIPGTIGGALAMNAGAFGGETWETVKEVEMITRQGELLTRARETFDIGYRHVSGYDNAWFVSATFELPQDPSAVEQSKEKIKALLKKRADTQPTRQANAGSVFRNPPGDHAARLIEKCGLKGHAINNAQVSEKHANFIINNGGASSRDVEELIRLVQSKVRERFDIDLEPEVLILGEDVPA